MAKKKTYYDPHDGNHYYHGETLGASNWGAPESVKDESYINQYNYTPSYNAYRQYLEEEKRRREEEERRAMQNQVLKAGEQGQIEQLPDDGQSHNIIDLRDVNAARTQRTVDRIKNAADSAINPLTWIGAKDKVKPQDVIRDQRNDILVENYTNTGNDKNTLQQLDQKINSGRTLTPDEEVQYSEAKLRQYYKKHPGLEKLMIERNDYHSASNEIFASNMDDFKKSNYMSTALGASKKVENDIKKLTGWSDEELSAVLKYADRVQDRKDTLASAKKYEIDQNSSVFDQRDKGISNTVYGLANNRGVNNFVAWADNLSSEKPKGFGANTDNGVYRKINNSSAAIGETSKALKADASKIVSAALGKDKGEFIGDLAGRAYESGVSAVDSELTKIPGIIVSAATGNKQLGEAVGLAPYFFKSFNSDYIDARQKGATEEEARQRGTLSGLIEVATELVGIDNFIDNTLGKNAGKSFVKNLIKQMASEGLEEGLSDILNEFADSALYAGDDEVKSSWQQRVEETGSVGGAFVDFLKDFGLDIAFGALSAGPASGGSMALGAHNYNNIKNNISSNARDTAQNIKGDSEYEKSVKAQMEQYEKNPTRYIADNLAENSEEDKQRKAEVMALAKKEANGEELTAGEKLFIEQAMAESEESEKAQAKKDKKEGKTLEVKDNQPVPLKYQDKVSNWDEDEARTRLAEAAKAGDVKAYADAMQMTMNSSNKSVSERADEIISDYAGMAQSHGITQEDIGKAVLSMKKAYIAGLNGEKLDKESMSNENREAFNEGQMEALKSKERSIIEKDALTNTEVTTKDGHTIKLDGVFNSDGKIKAGNSEYSFEDLDITKENAVMKAYKAADSYENVNVKNGFLSLLKDGQNIDFYTKDFATIYDSAMAGISLENTKKSFASQRLDDETIQKIHDLGVRERGARAGSYLSEMFTGVKGGKGHVINESSSQDKNMLDAAQMIAGAMGIDLRLIDPNESGEQGSFKKSESVITVRTDDFMRALGHEIAEFTEAYNKEEYDKLRNAVANFASEKLGNDQFLSYMRGDKEMGLKGYAGVYSEHNLDSSSDEMSGEMFNDIVPIILGSKKGRKVFAEFLAKNYQAEEARSLGEQAVDYMKKIGKMIKNVFADVNHNSAYAKQMQKYANELGEKYADEFLQALDGAIANYQKAPKVENAESDLKHSLAVDDSVYLDIEGDKITGKDLLGTIQLGRLEDSYEDYVNNPQKYEKTKAGDVIIPIEAIGGGVDKIAIVDSTKYRLICNKLYVVADDVFNREKAISIITEGEINGEGEKLGKVMRSIFGSQGFYEYTLENNRAIGRPGAEQTRLDGFKNNGFGRNSLNRKGLDSSSTGSKSEVAQGSSFSLSVDSDGNSLSQDQIEYFNQSKVRDKDGSLLVMHHGTSAYGFDVFDIKKASAAGLYGRGFYFSNEPSHAGQYGKTYDVYLNIVNPLTPGAKTITDNQMLKFINAIANDEDYGIENYGQEATPQSVLKSLKGKDDFSALQDLNATCIGDFAGALKLFNRINGTSYDGIITPTETVAFYSNQIKDINNKKPTESDNINFSISVDEANQIKKKAKKSKAVDITPNLIAVHNLGEEQLKETLKLQGLPSPSIAIIKSGMLHDKYGEISLVFNSDTIDPKKSAKNKVYGGDGWTPTFPRIEVKINRKAAERIWDKIDSLVSATEQRSIGYANVDTDNLEDRANRNRGDVVDAYRDNRSLKYAFLKENGIKLDVPMTDARLDDRFSNEQVLAAAKVIKDLKEAESLRSGYSAYENNPELVEKLRKALNDQFREKYANTDKKLKVLDKDLYEELSFSDFDFLTRGVYRYYKNGITQEMDSVAAKRAIDAAISEHEKEYDRWLKDLFKDIIEKRGLRNNKDVFLPSGNRRSWEALHDEYNLENIVKIMNQQDEKGEAAFFSQSAIQALATKNFKSLDEIRNAANQLYVETDEEHEKRVNEQSERFTEICNEIMDKSEPNSFIAFGRASDAIADAIREGKTVRGIDRVLREYRGLNIHEDTAQEIVDLMNDIAENPTGYFEAKPKRAVWLDEIQKAIIPDNVSDELIEALKEAGIPYETYRYEDEGMRRDILAGMDDVKFSLDVDSDGKELTKDQKEYFKDSKVVDDNGNLMVLYHGSSNAGFTTFNDDEPIYLATSRFTANKFTSDPSVMGKVFNSETGRGEIYKCYANIENPLIVNAEKTIVSGKVNADIEYYKASGKYNLVLTDKDGNKYTFTTYNLSDYFDDKTINQINNYFDKHEASGLYDAAKYSIRGKKVDVKKPAPYWDIDFNGKNVELDDIVKYAREQGHDGVIVNNVIEGPGATSREEGTTDVVVFKANQIKETSNEHPSDNSDIRYSIEVDSEGRVLTEGQQKYFNDTKAVDENGALRVMYHGTNNSGFTVFDPEFSDDKISLFFSANEEVSKSYIYNGARKRVDLSKEKPNYPNPIKDAQTAKEYLEAIGYTNISSKLKDYGTWSAVYWDFTTPNGKNIKNWENHAFIDLAESSRKDNGGVYAVYLNIQNPLIIDAEGNQWNRLNGQQLGTSLRGPFGVGINSAIDLSIKREEDGLYTVASDMREIYGKYDIGQIADEFGEYFAELVRKADRDIILNNVILYEGARKLMIPNDTRGAALLAKLDGNDGVIIKNVRDNGGGFGFAENTEASAPHDIIIAFNPEQVKDINNLNPTSSEDIRYALDLAEDEGGWVDFDDILGIDSTTGYSEEKAIDILEKGMEALKNKEVDLPKLRTLALKIRNEFGSSYNANTLTENLRKAFAYMQTEDHVDYQTMMGILKDIARPVIEESNEKVGEEEYRQFLDLFKGTKIKLTAKQKEEVKYTYGSYGKFRNSIMPITISDNADTTLDQIWDELVKQSGYLLDRDANEGDMPLNLLDTLQAMRPTLRNTYGGDIEDVSRDLAMRIVEEYFEGESAKQMKNEIAEIRARLKKDYDERRKELKGQINAEARARNKRKSEKAKDRERTRYLKQDIKSQSYKLLTWIQKPIEGKSVPYNMVVPITEFLQAIDFVDPIVMVNKEGQYIAKIFDHVDLDENNHPVKFYYNNVAGYSRAEVLRQYNEALGRGEGSKEQRAWAERMQGIRDIYNKVLRDDDFEDTSMDFLMQGLDAQGLAEEFDDMLSRHKGSLNMNQLSSDDLNIIDKVLKNIIHAVNQANKAYSSPSVDIVNLAQSTIQDSEGKEIPSRNKILEGVYKMFRLDNVTPRTYFKLLGRRGIEVYKFLRDGLNQEIRDLKKASDFMEEAMEGIDAKKWTGRTATVHEFPVSSGTIRMTDGQIMSLYCTVRRNGATERIKGGLKADDIYTKGAPIKQKAMHLTDADIAKIESVLTPEQIALTKKMQKYMAQDCSEMGNETSMKLYGYKKFTDDTYYPWTVDKDTVATTNTSENIPMFTGIERSGFTKQLKEGATNPLVIRDIFDVFTDHVSQMAAYHGYAAAVKDTLRWMNYREQERKDGFVEWITNKNAINALTGTNQGVSYIRNLLLDINKANKSQYIGNMTDLLMGNYKAAAVGANLRVVAQQPTAYFRALNMIDPKYLFTVNPKTAIRNIAKSQEECPISWWKSKGYYETNLGQPIKEIVTGIASPIEKAKDKLMAPAGYADDITWGFLYSAVEKEQRDKLKGKNVSESEFRKAVNDRFDELVDNTQVVDSTLHRSQYMRSTDRLNKIQTAFMAEPTKSYNMLLEAGIEDLNDKDKTMKRTRRATTAFLLSALATSAAAAVVDALRKSKDDDKWWEVWLDNLKSNMADNMNPFNLLPVVKDVSAYVYNLATGNSTYGMGGSRFDTEAISSLMGAISAWKKLIEGESNKTAYGFIMANIKPLSQITGVPAYNLTKDVVALYNAFFTNIETTVGSQNAGRTEQKKDFVSDVNRERSEKILDEGIVSALEHGVSIYDLKGALESEYKNKYFDAIAEDDMDKAKEIGDKAARAYARMGLSDEEIDDIINGWAEEVVTYAELDRAIANGDNVADEILRLRQVKDDDKIIKHLVDRYAETIAYEDTHNTDSKWREGVEQAIVFVDPSIDFDTAHEEALQKKRQAQEDAANTEKNSAMKADFFDAVEAKDGSAGRKALETMKQEGIEGKTVKASVSTRYHEIWKKAESQADKDKAKSDWKSAYTLVDNVYGTKSKNLDKTWSDWEKDQKE